MIDVPAVRLIVDGMSALIMNAARALDAEGGSPSTSDADRYDGRVDFYRTRVQELRRLRQEFEDVAARSPY